MFQREYLTIAKSIQETIGSNADEVSRIGRVEYPIRVFHDAIDRALGGEQPPLTNPRD